MDVRASMFGWIFFVFMVLVLFGGFVVLWVLSEDKVVVDSSSNVSNVTYGFFLLGSGAVSGLNYSVLNDSGVVVAGGRLLPGVFEKVDGLVNGSNLSVVYWGDYYYVNRSVCWVNDSKCVLDVSLKARDFVLGVNDSGFWVDSGVGVLRDPLVCFSYDSSLLGLRVSGLSLGVVPIGFERLIDFCYGFGGDLVGRRDGGFVLFRNSIVSVNGSLSLWVFDREVSPGVGVGYKKVSMSIV